MTTRVAAVALLVVVAYGCRTTAPLAQPKPAETLNGVASWYGEEFAGRTTANGEIFDPGQLTAAHRTLPFGTVLDVTNLKTKQTVRVRVNDRGPFIGGRVLDLSYAAAQKIGLIEPGIGEVQIAVVRIGNGDHEPPVPFEATVAEAPNVVPVLPPPSDAPAVPIPIPAPVATTPAPAPAEPVVVDRIEVQTERAGVVTRTQVSADGRTLEEVPVSGAAATPTAERYDAKQRTSAHVARSTKGLFFVQVGAFSVEANAKALQEQLAAISQKAWVDRTDLYRVRMG
ncbi:MAG TPA: septal ring lytic transglycosylase RlpA family protein, partial [Thermoanaerobaculia bacterium]|nr:septal ring lytic transglycosylase RlpA family protein [Thermoanaerobaculia bacterium]